MCAARWRDSHACFVWMLVWKRSLSWMPQGVRKLCGYAFGLPDRHPTVLDCGAVRCPCGVAGRPWWMFGGTCGAWWFENWIVDASKRNSLLFSFCLSRFRQTPFFGVWFRDRSFCDHFYSVMICRLANLAINGPHGGPVRIPGRVVVKGVWWMPWQTVPMKDV